MMISREMFDLHFSTHKPNLPMEVLRYFLLFCGGGFALLFAAMNGWTLPTIDQLMPSNEHLEISVNKSVLVRLNQPALRVSIVAPSIADVQIMDAKQILVTALAVGETTLLVWMDEENVRTIDVSVRTNTRPIADAIQQSMPDEAIEVMPMSDGVALRGQVHGIGSADQAMEIAGSFSSKVVNLLNVPGIHQVLLKVKIAEVARSFQEETGFNFQILDNNIQTTSTLGNLVSGTVNQQDLTVSDAVTLFMGLPNSNINAFIQALQEKGMIHILAEPNLVARSGESASFLAGGEFPVPVVQGGGISNAVTIEYKEFGVRLQFTPTVLNTKDIRLQIAPEVSDLDFAQGVRVSGFQVPALITRRAQTVVVLQDGQSFAIAGLLSKTKMKNRRKVPVAGDLPLFGGIFRGGDITEKETELLIMVTPYLVSPLSPDETQKMPGYSIEEDLPEPFSEKDDRTKPNSPKGKTPAAPQPPDLDSSELPVLPPASEKNRVSIAPVNRQTPKNGDYSAGRSIGTQPIPRTEILSSDLPPDANHKPRPETSWPREMNPVISQGTYRKPGMFFSEGRDVQEHMPTLQELIDQKTIALLHP